MSDDIKGTVKGMAALVLNSGRLSEFHERNLKIYPLIFFEDVTDVRIEYDLSVRHDAELDKANNLTIKKPLQFCYVSYYLTIKEESNKEQLQRRFETLERSVQTLFWKELPVEIYFNNKIVFKSKKNG